MAEPSPGLYASLKGLLGSSLTLLQTRLQLLAVELAEERQRLMALLLWGAVAAMALGAGLLFAALWLTVLLWDSHRELVLGLFTLAFVGLGVVAAAIALRMGRAPSGLFASSLSELTQDRAALRAAPAADSGNANSGSRSGAASTESQ